MVGGLIEERGGPRRFLLCSQTGNGPRLWCPAISGKRHVVAAVSYTRSLGTYGNDGKTSQPGWKCRMERAKKDSVIWRGRRVRANMRWSLRVLTCKLHLALAVFSQSSDAYMAWLDWFETGRHPHYRVRVHGTDRLV